MNTHRLTIENVDGRGVFTKVELDGQPQAVTMVALEAGVNGDLQARLVYPAVAVAVDVQVKEPEMRYRARLHVVDYPGVRADGYGKTVADAIRDLASKVEDR